MSSIVEALKLKTIPTAVRVRDLISTDVPLGYFTIGMWWAEREAQALERLYDPVSTLAEEADKLLALCDRRGIKVLEVSPSRVAADLGFKFSRAFPETLLLEHYTTNP